jgi:CDP-diacylglycerol---serine O-phosphatidyltransferase
LRYFKGTLPNVLTLMNLSLGVMAILFAVNGSGGDNLLIPASLLIMVAALTDRFDGKVARMLDATSELGKELDSLSDLISFGVAPVIIAWKINFVDFGVVGYLLVLIFPIAGAYRLARYNTTSFDNIFRGIPITIAGAFLTILNLYECFAILNHRYTKWHTLATVLFIFILSVLMISKVKVKKL